MEDDGGTSCKERWFGIASAVILVLSIGLAALWIANPALNLEPALVLLGLLYAAVPLTGGWIVRRLSDDLERERLSMPYALAYGYLTNFLAPVVRQLRKTSSDPDGFRFYVYIPRTLDELKVDSISEILSELESRNYRIETVELSYPDEKRSKDFRTARKSPGGDGTAKYFDFPTTLLALEQAVEFKLDTREGSFPFRQRQEIGLRYIQDFRAQLETMLKTERYNLVRRNVCIVDGGLDFLDRGANPGCSEPPVSGHDEASG